MVQGIAHQMHQRVGNALDDGFVQFGFATDDFQRHVLGQFGCGVAHDPAKAAEGLADGHHAQLQGAVADFLDQTGDLLIRLDQTALARFTGQQRGAGTGDDQLSQQVDDGVEPVGLHADQPLVVDAALALALLLLQGGIDNLRTDTMIMAEHFAKVWLVAGQAQCALLRIQ